MGRKHRKRPPSKRAVRICLGKKLFPTLADAEEFNRARCGNKQRPYYCEICLCYHLTSRQRPRD